MNIQRTIKFPRIKETLSQTGSKLIKGGTNRHITARIISALSAASTLERARSRAQKGHLKKRSIDDTSRNRDTGETGSARETKNKQSQKWI